MSQSTAAEHTIEELEHEHARLADDLRQVLQRNAYMAQCITLMTDELDLLEALGSLLAN